MTHVIRKMWRALFDYDPSFCDMYKDAAARVAGEEYLGYMRSHIQKRFGPQQLSILDAGCQAGRLLIPLAEDGHHVTGLDTSLFALRRARRRAKARHLSIALHRGNIADLRRWIQPSSVDVVVCTEVLYLCRNYRQLLQQLADSVKPGGLLFVSHRPTLYYVAGALCRAQSADASSFLARTEGRSPDGAYHNWQTPEQLMEVYRSLDLRQLGCYPIRVEQTKLDLSMVADAEVRRLLASVHAADDRYRIPTYFLVVAQRATKVAA